MRFTLFNCITLFVAALTVLVAILRFRANPRSSWFFLYYVPVIVGFAVGFEGSLNPYAVGAGVALAIVIRFGVIAARWAELLFFAYVLLRCVGLLLGWSW